MSSFRVLSKKTRFKIGLIAVVIIHLGFFYGFWHVKARQLGHKFVELDIYSDTNKEGLAFYEALADDQCVNVINEQPAKEQPELTPAKAPNANSSEMPVLFTKEPPLVFASAPSCRKSFSLPEGYEKLGDKGFIGLEINVDTQGKVEHAEVDKSSGFPELDKAAVTQVVNAWSFNPCKKGDNAVVCKQYIKFRWKGNNNSLGK